jgi:hypothetical protein
MGIHMVIDIANERFNVTLYRDDAGNYVADAVGPLRTGSATGASTPLLRVIDATKERAMKSLLDSLRRMTGASQRDDSVAPALG